MVGVGVGIAAILGTVRFVKGWSLKPMIYLAIFPVFVLTIYTWLDPNLKVFWDWLGISSNNWSSYSSTGFVVGHRYCQRCRKGWVFSFWFWCCNNGLSFPNLAVLILAIFVSFSITPDEIIAAAKTASNVVIEQPSVWDQTPLVEVVLGVRAILPLVLFLMFVLFVV